MPSSAKAKPTKGGGGAEKIARIPFIQAAHQLSQPMQTLTSAVLGAATQQFGPYDVPSGGFLRYIDLFFVASGGTAGSGALAGDAPWNVIQSISLSDVNGKNLLYPVINGYDLYLLNRFGSYHYCPTPEIEPDAALTSVVAWKFMLRIPVEIDHDGVGALPNLNAAETYKLSITLNTAAKVYSTAPTTAPIVTCYMQTHDWSLPSAVDGLGQAQDTWPPMANEFSQTTQYNSKQVFNLVGGANTLKVGRMGNILRNLIVVARDTNGARTSDYPSDMQVLLDKYQITKERAEFRRSLMEAHFRHYGYAIPTGVFIYPFMLDGPEGFEGRHNWQPTMQPTELRLEGTFAGTATSLEIITNDIAPGGK